MAIKRQAENPGQNLMLGESLKYSLKTTQKKKLTEPKNTSLPTTSLPVVKKDLVYTAGVFLLLLLILGGLYYWLR